MYMMMCLLRLERLFVLSKTKFDYIEFGYDAGRND